MKGKYQPSIGPGWFFRNLFFGGCNVFPPACAKNLLLEPGEDSNIGAVNGRCQIAMFVAHVRILIVWYAMSLALGSAMSLALKVWQGGGSLDVGCWSPRGRS